MKKMLLITIIMFFVLFSNSFAENIFPGEVDLENYFNDFNVQTLNTKHNEIFQRKGAADFEKRDKNTFKRGDLSLNFQSNKTHDSKYLLGGVEHRSTLNIEKNRFGFSTGAHGSYTRENLSNATRELFFAPKYNISKRVSLELDNYLDAKGDYFTQELGLKYKTKYLKNGTVGISGGTKFNKDSTRSEKLKFSTEFYLF